MTAVLDASALLAFAHGEAGADHVERALGEGIMSAVNWSEVVQKSEQRGVDTRGLRADFEAMGLRIEAFTLADAECAAALWPRTRSAGLSLGDRACLALAQRSCQVVMTTDRAWLSLATDLGLDVRCVR